MSACPKSQLADPSTMLCIGNACALYSQLDDVLEHNQHLEQEAAHLRNALVKARSDLQGTRAGERRARHSAEHDGLTRLPNRVYFESCLKEAIAERGKSGKALALFFLDLDDFKLVNDQHGHAAGDTVLRVVAARLSRAVRKDDVVCRLGGDEFAGLLRGLGHTQQLIQLAEKLVETVAAPCRIESGRLTVRPSIGIAVCPDDGATGLELLARADAAMYRAKRQRSGYAFFEIGA